MAVAAWLVCRDNRPERAVAQRTALTLWWVQLALNLSWSVAFFGLKRPAWGLGVIGLLELAILATTLATGQVSRLAAALLAPYGLWTAFASVLNYRIWQLNEGGRDR
jgi:tryptophan-rich sensory protein